MGNIPDFAVKNRLGALSHAAGDISIAETCPRIGRGLPRGEGGYHGAQANSGPPTEAGPMASSSALNTLMFNGDLSPRAEAVWYDL
jgi:hypothetical protein